MKKIIVLISLVSAFLTGHSVLADANLPQTWNKISDLPANARGAYILRSLENMRDPQVYASCPIYFRLSIDKGANTVFFESKPIYYDLDSKYEHDLRNNIKTGFWTDVFKLSGASKFQNGTLSESTVYLGGAPSTVRFYKIPNNMNLFVEYTLLSEGFGKDLHCQYERTADSMVDLYNVVSLDVQSKWKAAKASVEKMSDSEVNALCDTIVTSPYWGGRDWWNGGLCEGNEAALDRSQMVQAVDDVLVALAKLGRMRGLQADLPDALIGLERLYRIPSRRAILSYAATEVFRSYL